MALWEGKAPGLDGLPPEFYLSFWDQVGSLINFDKPTRVLKLSPSCTDFWRCEALFQGTVHSHRNGNWKASSL